MEYTPRYPCDMHCHTVRSDGNDTPQELIENAAKLGMKVIGICDHDTPPPLDIVESAKNLGLKVIPGYEFSCDTQVDDVHICGYGLDWNHPALAEEVQTARNSKSNAYRELCEILTAKGIVIDWDKDILNGRGANDVERKHIFEAIAAKGYCPTWSDAKIMVRDDPELNVKRRKIEPVAAIKLIHDCGGIAVLAHPYLIDEEVCPAGLGKMSRDAYIDRLIEAGLDGIEASYTYDKTSYKGTLTPEQVEAEVRSKYTGRIKFFSGGSDYHADHKKGSKKVRMIGERGITEDEFNTGLQSKGY